MFVRMNGLYGMNCTAWYRKSGDCFDFVNDKKYASDLLPEECERIVKYSDWYCKQFGAANMTIEK